MSEKEVALVPAACNLLMISPSFLLLSFGLDFYCKTRFILLSFDPVTGENSECEILNPQAAMHNPHWIHFSFICYLEEYFL